MLLFNLIRVCFNVIFCILPLIWCHLNIMARINIISWYIRLDLVKRRKGISRNVILIKIFNTRLTRRLAGIIREKVIINLKIFRRLIHWCSFINFHIWLSCGSWSPKLNELNRTRVIWVSSYISIWRFIINLWNIEFTNSQNFLTKSFLEIPHEFIILVNGRNLS